MKKMLFLGLLLSNVTLAQRTLVYAASGDPVSLDSGNIVDRTSMLVHKQIYDTLIGAKNGTTDASPALAVRWVSDKNATQWTFFLRKNVKFHDGTDFNADAVLFNINRWWDKNSAYGYAKEYAIWAQMLGGYKGTDASMVRTVQKLDDHTVQFTLKQPFTSFPQVIGSGYFGMASPSAVQKAGAKYGTPASSAVGTGAFVLQEWQLGDKITLTPNKRYWGAKSKVAALIIKPIKEASARLNELRAGTAHFASDLNPDDLDTIAQNPSLKVILKPSFNVGFLSLNTKNPYLNNPKVREAISLAINKKAIISALYGDLGITDSSFLPQSLAWANSKNLPSDYPYNPEKARKLLQEAGYNTITFDLWYPPIARQYYPNPKALAEALAAELAQVGIVAQPKTQDWAKFISDSRNPSYDSYIIGWVGDFADPDNFYGYYYGTLATQDVHFLPETLKNLLQQGKTASTKMQKAQIYSKIHELTYNAYVRIPLVHSKPLAAQRSEITGWIPSPLGVETFNTISFK